MAQLVWVSRSLPRQTHALIQPPTAKRKGWVASSPRRKRHACTTSRQESFSDTMPSPTFRQPWTVSWWSVAERITTDVVLDQLAAYRGSPGPASAYGLPSFGTSRINQQPSPAAQKWKLNENTSSGRLDADRRKRLRCRRPRIHDGNCSLETMPVARQDRQVYLQTRHGWTLGG